MHHFKQRNVKIALIVLAVIFLLAAFFNSELVVFFFNYLVLYRYVTLFIIVFLAGLCVPIPMNILLMGAGALSIEGHFIFSRALILAVVANVSGDMIAFLLFRKYSPQLLREQFINKYPFFMRLEEHFIAHTNIVIFASRIIGIFGTPVNFLSGLTKVHPLRFLAFDVMGNLAFVFLFLKIGYIVGDQWLAISKYVGSIVSVLSALVFVFIIAFVFYKKRKQ